ncbi:MAG: hypothetical protein IKU68_05560 [Oscillospiraceae bacterium]|nr:hypothetical protein [Oscillospiraceae bacterium]
MAEKKHRYLKRGYWKQPGIGYAVPFFVVLALLTVVSFIIPLRPAVSNSEKRELAKFPEFSISAIASGSYFDDISKWYSDTFPGRESWLQLSTRISTLHGYSEIAFEGSLEPVLDDIPVQMQATVPEYRPEEVQQDDPVQMEGAEETLPPEEIGWGGVNAGEGAEISLGTAIQIGDTAFNQLGFSQIQSDRYINTLNSYAAAVKDKGVRVISCPAPTAIGVMVEKDYLEMLNCAPQDDMINYLHSGMSDDIIKVDTFSKLVEHNDEYVYFRTDHHWTALGAYYAYEALCEATGMEAAPLDSFEEWDQGEMEGSLYGRVKYPHKLRMDNLTAYIPQGDISMIAYGPSGYGTEKPMLADKTHQPANSKYMTFLSGDNALSEVTNESLPDGPSCIVIKDSFGNCFVPFLTQNYHKIYAIDYRKYNAMSLKVFVEKYDIDDVIFAPYLTATQAIDGNDMFAYRVGW